MYKISKHSVPYIISLFTIPYLMIWAKAVRNGDQVAYYTYTCVY